MVVLPFLTIYINPFCERKYSKNRWTPLPQFLILLMMVVQELLLSYNIAVDRSDEMKRMLGKSASSVGLKLPEVYEP